MSVTCLYEGKCIACISPIECREKYGRPLTDEEFEKVKERAAATRGERLKDLYGTDEEFQRRMEIEQARLEEFSSTHKLEDEVWKPKDVVRYHRITLRFSTVRKIWDAVKGTIQLLWGK